MKNILFCATVCMVLVLTGCFFESDRRYFDKDEVRLSGGIKTFDTITIGDGLMPIKKMPDVHIATGYRQTLHLPDVNESTLQKFEKSSIKYFRNLDENVKSYTINDLWYFHVNMKGEIVQVFCNDAYKKDQRNGIPTLWNSNLSRSYSFPMTLTEAIWLFGDPDRVSISHSTW